MDPCCAALSQFTKVLVSSWNTIIIIFIIIIVHVILIQNCSNAHYPK